MKDILYWLATSQLEEIGPVKLRKWIEFFGELKTIFSVSAKELHLAGLTEKQIASIQSVNWQLVEKDFAWCQKNNCTLLTWADEHYPVLLKEMSGGPPILYVQGNAGLLNQPQLAIVGARNASTMGLESAERFAYQLAQAGLVVTSGLAMGVDGAGHRGALAATGKTIAVMGTGLGQIYPRVHTQLAEEIRAKGALVSEFAPRVLAKAPHFPMRNRVISGLSMGVLVIEAALKSGSLITARYAVEQGREVFAMPGSIHYPLARGCHYLIRQGAKLVETIEDILLELAPLRDVVSSQHLPEAPAASQDLDEVSRKLLAQIGPEPTALDTITARSGLTPSTVSSMLLLLELKGYVSAVPGGYARSRY